MSGTGYGHGGPVGEILDALPTDSTFHITDCGYDDNGGRCGCYDLPAKLRKIVRAAQAAAWNEGHRFTGYAPERGENPYEDTDVVSSPDSSRPTCWRSECRTGCYYPDVCSEKPSTTPGKS